MDFLIMFSICYPYACLPILLFGENAYTRIAQCVLIWFVIYFIDKKAGKEHVMHWTTLLLLDIIGICLSVYHEKFWRIGVSAFLAIFTIVWRNRYDN